MFIPYHIEKWLWVIDTENAGIFDIRYNVKINLSLKFNLSKLERLFLL